MTSGISIKDCKKNTNGFYFHHPKFSNLFQPSRRPILKKIILSASLAALMAASLPSSSAVSFAFSLAPVMTQDTSEEVWNEIPQADLLYLEFETGMVTFHLAEFFAPHHTSHIRDLVNAGLYDGIPLYRVIENFVVQGGPNWEGENDEEKALLNKKLMAEMERPIDKNAAFYLVQENDLMAEQTGYINGFPVGRSLSENKEWLIHCNGAINLARNNDPNSGTTQFAIMFGGYQRYLDRNMSIFGRIISGWDAYYKVKRAPVESGGVFKNYDDASKIISANIGSNLPLPAQQRIFVENVSAKAFDDRVKYKRNNDADFFVEKGNGNMNVCLRPPTYQIKP
jgi:peptidylprolyl isomerase